MMMTGNKGEWSELYVLVKLLSTGRLYSATKDSHGMAMCFPIVRIIRRLKDENKSIVSYNIDSKAQVVTVLKNAEDQWTISCDELAKDASYLYGCIIGGKNSFPIIGADKIMKKLLCDSIGAPSTDKKDITLDICDLYTGRVIQVGYSIKSDLGHPPTLLNASKATNFSYKVEGMNETIASEVNAIDSKNKIIDRLAAISENGCSLSVCHAKKEFRDNLILIDTFMDDIIADILIDYYTNNISSCDKLIKRIEERDPLKYGRKGVYTYKFKKMLCSIALGMVPGKEWNGHDEANGGYIIVRDRGSIEAYHLYNRDDFETYLLEQTRLEKASTTRHDYAILYNENGDWFINLNLQIRFI